MTEKTITIGGNPYRLTAISARDYQDVLEEYRRTAPDPVRQVLDTAAMLPDGIKEDFIRKHLDEAFEAKKQTGSMTDPGFQAYMSGLDGACKVFAKMFRRHHPHLTEAEAFEAALQGVAEHGDDLFRGLFPVEHARPANRGGRRGGVLPPRRADAPGPVAARPGDGR